MQPTTVMSLWSWCWLVIVVKTRRVLVVLEGIPVPAEGVECTQCAAGEAGLGVCCHHHCSTLHRVCPGQGSSAGACAVLGPLAGVQHLDYLCCGHHHVQEHASASQLATPTVALKTPTNHHLSNLQGLRPEWESLTWEEVPFWLIGVHRRSYDFDACPVAAVSSADFVLLSQMARIRSGLKTQVAVLCAEADVWEGASKAVPTVLCNSHSSHCAPDGNPGLWHPNWHCKGTADHTR